MVNFKVTILGCGSAMPNKNHWPSAQLVRYDNQYFICDAGEGLQYHLNRHHVSTTKVRAIFVTHMHIDHMYGLAGYLLMLEISGRTTPLDIFGPEGLEEYINEQLTSFCLCMHFPLRFHTVRENGEIFRTGRLSVEAVRLCHRGMDCFGYVFRELPETKVEIDIDEFNKTGLDNTYINALKTMYADDPASTLTINGKIYKSSDFCRIIETTPVSRAYAYCTDNSFPKLDHNYPYSNDDPLARYMPLADRLRKAGVSALYHEASFMEKDREKADKYGHGTAIDAAQLAKLSGVKTLIIGHLSARYKQEENVLDEAIPIFLSTLLADEDDEFDVPTL